jgi:SAM-dependent MidA family methyltransferase
LSETPLKTYLLETIKHSGPITFEHYMSLCLYHPQYGYYMQGRERTGVRGDFFTSSDLHPVFARLVARQAREMWEVLGGPEKFSWVEMGAGRGLFASDFLRWVKRALPKFSSALHYIITEPGARNREKLLGHFRAEGLEHSVELRPDIEELEAVTGCFFSNELVDAFPVSVVTRSGGHLKEIYVTMEGQGLREKQGPISDPGVAAAVARYANQLEEGHRVEVSLKAADWIRSVTEKLSRGFVLTIDYGDAAERLFTPDRPSGTLMAYHRHVATEGLYLAPGEQDLTAHVNFSLLLDAGKKSGIEFTGFTTQERFLLALGEANEFADLYDPGQSEAEKLQARLKLKRLINPEGMGNIYKVLVQHRGVELPALTGLKYQRPIEP